MVSRIVIIILILLLCPYANSSGQQPDSVPIVYVSGLEQYDGLTTCTDDNKPLIIISTHVRSDSLNLEDTKSHEMVHVRHTREIPGGCLALQERYRLDPDFAYEVELRAYCDTMNRVLSRGGIRAIAVFRLSLFLTNNYPTKRSLSQVASEVERC